MAFNITTELVTILTDNVTDIIATVNDSTPYNMMLVGSPPLKIAHDVLIVVLLVAVMFSMGCHITVTEVWQHIKKPIGACIGMCSQFILLPLGAFCLILSLRLDPLHATGMLVLSCSPGGVTSNIFTYFCDGDVSLSVTMTTCSTIVALGMMPFNMWLYSSTLQTSNMVIPYDKMTISLAAVTTPVAAGMLFRWKLPKMAPYVTKIGSYAGFAIIFVCQTMELIVFPDIFDGIGWQFYVALFTLPSLGLCLGYGLAALFRQHSCVRKTIAIECSIQNIGTALTVISLSFPLKLQKDILAFPWLYSIPLLTTVTICCASYQIYKRRCMKKSDDDVDCEKKNGHLTCDHVGNNEETVAFMMDHVKQEKLTSV